jgi:hypothetical protein
MKKEKQLLHLMEESSKSLFLHQENKFWGNTQISPTFFVKNHNE